VGIKDEDMAALVQRLNDEVGDLWAGDMKRAEAMLYAQAHALQAIFVNLARRAACQDHLKQWEAYLRMALKTQNQCRMTLETLAAIKNPPVVIARQANINNGGQQQVNNGPPDGRLAGAPEPAPSRAGDSHSAQTELLEAHHGQGLDPGAAGTSGGADPQLAAVGTIDRAAER
jgi:hypothetical protein